MRSVPQIYFLTVALLAGICSLAVAQAPVRGQIEILRKIGPKGEGHAAARQAVDALNKAEITALPEVLSAIDGANPLAQNWLRGVAEAIAQKEVAKSGKLPIADLEKYLNDKTRGPRSRRLAFELIAKVDATAESRLIPGLLHDPSLELRRNAVALAITAAEVAEKADKAAGLAKYKTVFAAARDQDQIKQIADKLKALGEPADLVTHYGFVVNWRLMAPFDNVEDKGWDIAYPPEKGVDYAAEVDGKEGKIRWVEHVTKHEAGMVDLTTALAKHKGAICYATSEFVSDKEQEVDFRLNCVTANKVWVNGKELMANRKYHNTTGEDIDQYVCRASLKQGKNVILLKICQNEQTEPWAQRWQFQFRVCDVIGTPIFSQDRTLPKMAKN